MRGHHLAKAGVEMALWDLFGKSSGKSLREMLGGQRTQVSVGVSVGLQTTSKDLVEVVRRYLEQGYARVKLKIKPGRDVGDTAAVRKAFPMLRLQVDANSSFTLASAQALKPLDDLDLLLIEQPLFEDDIWDHRQLQREFRTPICLDESILSARHARYAIEMQACRIINIKAARAWAAWRRPSRSMICARPMAFRSGAAVCSRPGSAGPPIWRLLHCRVSAYQAISPLQIGILRRTSLSSGSC